MMAAKIKAITYCTILTIILASTICFSHVKAVPQMPHRFWGSVTVAGQPALNGTLVEAKINNITYASTTTLNENYDFQVPADDPDTPEIEGGKTGDLILFYVARTYATNYTFAIGGTTPLNLSVPAPTAYAYFTADVTNGTEPLTVTFMDQSMYFDTITSRTWDFGDTNITTTTNANITHTYIQNGTYTVSLTVNGTQAGQNITATETKTDYITVYDSKPKADFYAIPTSGTAPLTVNFHDNSTHYDNITQWFWDFGDGTNSTEQNPTHNYTVAGVYTVRLTVTETDGDVSTCTKENYITVALRIIITNPTTGSPVYTKAGKTITVSFTYSAENPKNITVNVYNSTATIGEETITNLQAGTVNGTVNVPLNALASDGKYNINAAIYTLEGLSGTDTEIEAVIVDNTKPTIGTPTQNPPKDNVQPDQPVKVSVNVTDKSGVKNVTLYYTNDTVSYKVPMNYNSTSGLWEATIPGYPLNTHVTYYIEAYDNAENYAVNNNNGQYFIYTVIPEFSNALIILLMLLALTAIATMMKWKKGLFH